MSSGDEMEIQAGSFFESEETRVLRVERTSSGDAVVVNSFHWAIVQPIVCNSVMRGMCVKVCLFSVVLLI